MSPRLSFRRLLPALFALALLGLAPRPASADVVRLRTGETVKGRVLTDRTNEQILVMEDYLSGAIREIAWGAVVDEDAERLQRAGGLKFVAQTMECDVIVYRLDDGSTATVRGKVEQETADALILRNLTSKDLRIPKARVVSRSTEECDPQEIYPSEELAQKRLQEDPPQDARGWYIFAQYCESVGAWTQAKEAYESAAADDAFLNRKLAQDGANRVASIIKDAEAVRTLIDLRTALGAQLWKRVRDGIEGFPAKHPEAGDAVKKKLETLTADFTARRAKAFADLAGKRLEPIVRDLIRRKVASKDVAYNDVQSWIRAECVKETFERLLREMQSKDPAVTEEEVKGFWENRPKRASSWRLARYGSGSFIVEPPKVLPKTGSKAPTQPQKGGNQGPAAQIELPKPPTRDDWWKDANTDTRAEFWFALFVEKSGLFEVDPKKDRVACTRCEGDGTITFTLSTGGQVTVLCPRCGGARFDYSVKFR
jgi:hypothetical protein